MGIKMVLISQGAVRVKCVDAGQAPGTVSDSAVININISTNVSDHLRSSQDWKNTGGLGFGVTYTCPYRCCHWWPPFIASLLYARPWATCCLHFTDRETEA